MSRQSDIVELIKSISGQANILTIPRVYISILRSHRAALFLSQCVYWSDRSVDGWFFKSFREWYRELGLNQHAIETCVKMCKKHELIEAKVERVGTRSVTFYRPDMDRIASAIVAHLAETAKSTKLVDLAETAKRHLAENANATIRQRLPTETTEGEHPPTLSFSPDVSQPVTETPNAPEASQGAGSGRGVSQGENGAARVTARRGKRQGGNGKGSERKPRPRDEYFDAIAWACSVDPATAGASIGKVKAALLKADPPYTADEVVAWRATWPAWKDAPPTLWQLKEQIGSIRVKPSGNGRANIRGAAGAGGKDNGRDRERDQEIIAQTERNRRELEAISDPVERQRRWEEMLGLR